MTAGEEPEAKGWRASSGRGDGRQEGVEVCGEIVRAK